MLMRRLTDYGLRGVVTALLVISGVIHLHLAKYYPAGKVISQESAFRIQAVVVFVLAAAVLLLPFSRRLIWGTVALVAGASLIALLLSRYWSSADKLPVLVNEPTWQVGNSYVGLHEKQIAALVEGIAALFGLAALSTSRWLSVARGTARTKHDRSAPHATTS